MQKIRIDFDNPGLPQHISAVENDSQSRFFQATLYENGKAYTAPAGASYSIMYRGFGPQNQGWYDTINDGAGKRAACAVSGNVVTCEIARQALQVPGHVSIVLCVTTGKGYMLKSWPIECDCKNDRYDSTAEIQSFFYITQVSNADWTQAIQAVEELKNTIDPTLSLSGKAADAKATGAKITSNENAITLISAQKGLIDGNINISKFVKGSHSTDQEGNLSYNAANEYAMTTPTEINLKNATSVSFSNFDSYTYAIIITYGTKWIRMPVTSNPFSIKSNATKIIINASRKDTKEITDYDLLNAIVTISSESKVIHITELSDLYNLPKKIKTLKDSSDIIGTENIDAFLINDNIDIDINTNANANIFSKVYGGNGTLTFTNWNPTNLSNTFKADKNNDYIYKCMHFPHSGTYPNLQYQDPNIIDAESFPFKIPIGSIYVNTDVAEEFDGLIRIIACNLFGYKKGYWYEINNRNIKWAQIYSLPWGTSDGTNIPITYQDGTALINLKNNKLTKNNALHFGTANTYATKFDYYIVKVTVRCNKDSCGLKVGVDSRDNISGDPTQIVESRTFALTANTILTAFAHNIPDSVYSRVITNFDNYVRLKVPHYYCGRVQINGFIINLLKDKKSVTAIKDLDSGEEAKIIINDVSVDTSTNNLIVVTERYSRIEVTAKKDIFLNVIVSDTDAIENYNFDLM